MIRIRLYWHRETDDLDLGTVYLDMLPPPGSLVVSPTSADPNTVWRVETIYIHPAQEHSAALRIATGRAGGQVGIYTLFVTPAEGPFHP